VEVSYTSNLRRLRLGEEKEEEERKKIEETTAQNITACPITQGGHDKCISCRRMQASAVLYAWTVDRCVAVYWLRLKQKLKSSLRATEMQSDLSSLWSVSLMILDEHNVSYFALCEHLGLLSVTGFEMEAKKYFSAPITVVSSEQLAGCVHTLPYQPPRNIILFIHKITVDSIVDGYG